MYIETKWVDSVTEWLLTNQTVENFEFYPAEVGDYYLDDIKSLEITFWSDKSLKQIREVLDKLSLYECEPPKIKKYKGCSIILKEYEFEAASEEIALDLLKERELENNETVLIETLRDYVDKDHLKDMLERTFGLDVISKIFRKGLNNA